MILFVLDMSFEMNIILFYGWSRYQPHKDEQTATMRVAEC